MDPSTATLAVRTVDRVAVIDVVGDLTPACETDLDAAWHAALDAGARGLVLNFTELAYLNSGGIGLLVTLLVRANRHDQKLAAFGLDEHYRQILALTRLDEVIAVHDREDEALAAAG